MKFTVVDLEEVPVAFVKAVGGVAQAPKAFDRLESRMESLRGKRFYGLFDVNTGEYRACVRLDESTPDAMGFDTGAIPAGRYARAKPENWVGKEDSIGPTFDELVGSCIEVGHKMDPTRPSIEFYRSQRELLCLVPITD